MTDWKYERCQKCLRDQRLAWSVNKELWNKVAKDWIKKTLCLECFLEMADSKRIEVKRDNFTYLGWIGENIDGDVLIQ